MRQIDADIAAATSGKIERERKRGPRMENLCWPKLLYTYVRSLSVQPEHGKKRFARANERKK